MVFQRRLFRRAVEGLDSEMLFDPTKEEFDR